MEKSKKEVIKRSAAVTVGLATVAWFSVIGYLWLKQDSLVFKGAKKTYEQDNDNLKTIFLPTPMGTIRCVIKQGDKNGPVILALPGTMGNPYEYVRKVSRFLSSHTGDPSSFTVISFTYLGYVGSKGKLDGKTLAEQGLMVAKHFGVTAIFGRSLGAGVGALVAAKTGLPAVLISPWDSLGEVACDGPAGKIIPAFIMRRIFKHDARPMDHANKAQGIVAMIYLTKDKTVLPKRTKSLFEHWSGPKTLRALDGGHDMKVELTDDEKNILLGFR